MSGNVSRGHDQRLGEASSGHDDGDRISGVRVLDFHWAKEAPEDYFRLEALDDEIFILERLPYSTTVQIRTERRGREMSESPESREELRAIADDRHRQDNQQRNETSS